MIVAIDGPGGVGKSTVSRGVAEDLSLPYLDTGSTYRAATLAVLRAGIDVSDERAILELLEDHEIDYHDAGVILDGIVVAADVRSEDVTANVSAVSAHPEVRRRIVQLQRDWVEKRGGSAVVEGRDIGTVVFPQAPVKVFLTARAEIRAARRSGDAEAATLTVSDIRAALEARDTADAERDASPMRPAADAHVIDTSDLDVDQVIAAVLSLTR